MPRIVGDALELVTRPSRHCCQKRVALNRGSRQTVPPPYRNGRWLNISAFVWNSGITHSVRSPGSISNARWTIVTPATTFACDRTTPFGWPVVPDV